MIALERHSLRLVFTKVNGIDAGFSPDFMTVWFEYWLVEVWAQILNWILKLTIRIFHFPPVFRQYLYATLEPVRKRAGRCGQLLQKDRVATRLRLVENWSNPFLISLNQPNLKEKLCNSKTILKGTLQRNVHFATPGHLWQKCPLWKITNCVITNDDYATKFAT
jgi:hypothetical protein